MLEHRVREVSAGGETALVVHISTFPKGVAEEAIVGLYDAAHVGPGPGGGFLRLREWQEEGQEEQQGGEECGEAVGEHRVVVYR